MGLHFLKSSLAPTLNISVMMSLVIFGGRLPRAMALSIIHKNFGPIRS